MIYIKKSQHIVCLPQQKDLCLREALVWAERGRARALLVELCMKADDRDSHTSVFPRMIEDLNRFDKDPSDAWSTIHGVFEELDDCGNIVLLEYTLGEKQLISYLVANTRIEAALVDVTAHELKTYLTLCSTTCWMTSEETNIWIACTLGSY